MTLAVNFLVNVGTQWAFMGDKSLAAGHVLVKWNILWRE